MARFRRQTQRGRARDIRGRGDAVSDTRESGAAPSNNELAVIRTALAAERTLMAWVRTALAMLSFGFTIYKFLNGLHEAGTIKLKHPQGPREIGLVLTVLGTGSLIAGVVQYWTAVRRLGSSSRLGVAFYVAWAVVVLGILIVIGIAQRLGPF